MFFGNARRPPPVGEASMVSPTQSSRMRAVGRPWRRSAGQISPVSWQAKAVIMSTLSGVPGDRSIDGGLELGLEPERVLEIGHRRDSCAAATVAP